MEEDKRILKDLLSQKYSEKILYALSMVKEEDEVNVLTIFERQAIERILNELERLQKEFEAVDNECSRLEKKEIELENALNSEKTVQNCLHCGKDTPLYCETCYQELISKNAELQLENEELQEEVMENDLKVIGAEEYTEASMREIIENYYTANEDCIPKQVVRDKIQQLENKFHFFAGREHIEWQDGEFDGEVCDDLALQIKVLKELLEE